MMLKNILILEPNDTSDELAKLVDVFSEGSRCNSNQIISIKPTRCSVASCGKMTHGYDMEYACKQMEMADILVIASPVYLHSFASFVQMVIDRYYAGNSRKSLKISGCALLSFGNVDGYDMFEPLVLTYNKFIEYFEWENLGVITAVDWESTGEEIPLVLARARELGASIR